MKDLQADAKKTALRRGSWTMGWTEILFPHRFRVVILN